MTGKVAAYDEILKAQAGVTGNLDLLLKCPQAVPQPANNILKTGRKSYAILSSTITFQGTEHELPVSQPTFLPNCSKGKVIKGP